MIQGQLWTSVLLAIYAGGLLIASRKSSYFAATAMQGQLRLFRVISFQLYLVLWLI